MKLALLDRDGVINHDSPEYIKSVAEWRPIDGSIAAITRLIKAGWRVCIVSNQSGIGRGLITIENLAAIHAELQTRLQANGAHVEGFFFCPHHPNARCRCRKPAPGLLRDIARRLNTDLKGAPFIGDTMKDILAAQAVGAAPMLVRTGLGEETIADPEFPAAVPVFDNLAAAVAALLKQPDRHTAAKR